MLEEGKNYRLWVEAISDRTPEQVKTEGYARFLKQKQNEAANRKNVSNIRERVVRKITGLDVAQEKNPLFNPDSSDESRQVF
jgi:hypothetical protein